MQKTETLFTNPLDTASLLERLFKSAENATNGQISLINLYDYVVYSLKNQATKAIIDDLEGQRAEEYKTYYRLKSESEKELKKSKTILLDIIAKNKLKNPELDSEVQDLERFESGSISMSGLYVTSLEGFLFDICKNLLENGHRNLIAPFIDGTKRPQNIFGNFTFSKSLPLFYKERDRIEYVKKIEIWECWEKLKFVPEISRLSFNETMRAQVHVDDEEVSYFVDFLCLNQEVGKGGYNYQNDLAEYKNHLTRLHTHFIQQLNENIATPSKQMANTKLTFYSDGLADYRGVTSTFAQGSKGYALLHFLYGIKNTPFNLRDFQTHCNGNINIEKHKFKEEKDILDTINYTKTKLKVKKSEYFPIMKKGKAFIWVEK